MYKTDFIVRYHEIENELVRRLEVRLASEAAAEITAAIESVFKNAGDHSNENIVINVEVGGDSDDETGHRGRRIEVVNSNKKPVKEDQTLDKEQSQAAEEDDDVEDEEPNKEGEEEEEQSDEDYKYNRKDITYICEKLYRDELLEVFGAESIDDPKMDEGIKAIFEKLIKNEEFKTFLVEMNGLISDPNTAKTETELANLKRNTDYLIFITLFSQKMFYLTHRCLCQMLILGHVEADMMELLKQRTLKLFQISDKPK